MRAADIHLLFDYNYWANDRILVATAKTSTADFTAEVPVSFRSLRGTLVHILSTEWLWRMRCQQGTSPTAFLSEAQFSTPQALETRWAEERREMLAYLSTLRDADMERNVEYATTRGIRHTNTLWHLLVHVVNHGTQFRSEAGVLLSQIGQSPGDVDLIFFLRNRGQSGS